MLLFPDALHTAHYVQFFCFKIEIKTKADLYMPCKAMAHSTDTWDMGDYLPWEYFDYVCKKYID
jgi:hypothetical protein